MLRPFPQINPKAILTIFLVILISPHLMAVSFTVRLLTICHYGLQLKEPIYLTINNREKGGVSPAGFLTPSVNHYSKYSRGLIGPSGFERTKYSEGAELIPLIP